MITFFPTIALSDAVQLWADVKEFISNGALILDNFFAVLPSPISTIAAIFTSVSIVYLIVGRN